MKTTDFVYIRRMITLLSWILLWSTVFSSSDAESTDLRSKCPSEVQKSSYLKAAPWGKCYEFHLEERTWRNANFVCGRKGGHLVTIKEERVQIFLIQALASYRWPRNGIWLGATDKEQEMDWRWITGERVKDGYSKWAPGQPSCGILCFEDCALLRWKERGLWHDYKCNWLEDYSFICEYDMLPEPTTPTSITVTTTTTAVPISTTTTTTSVLTITNTSTKALEHEYLLHGHRVEEEGQNNYNSDKDDVNATEFVIVQAEIARGIGGARAEQVQDRETPQSSGVGSGTMAMIIIGIGGVLSLAVGLCMVLIMRRRWRKQIREDDTGISYENPYYEESKAPLTNRSDHYFDDSEPDSPDDGDEIPGACGAGFVTETDCKVVPADKKEPEVMQQSSSLQSRPRCVMNNYDTPPALSAVVQGPKLHSADPKVHVAKGGNKIKYVKEEKEEENYYDEIRCKSPGGVLAYDVPRASKCIRYEENENKNGIDSCVTTEQMYCNFYEENIYESLEHLEAQEEQLTQSETEELATSIMDEGEDRYVPFVLDGQSE